MLFETNEPRDILKNKMRCDELEFFMKIFRGIKTKEKNVTALEKMIWGISKYRNEETRE